MAVNVYVRTPTNRTSGLFFLFITQGCKLQKLKGYSAAFFLVVDTMQSVATGSMSLELVAKSTIIAFDVNRSLFNYPRIDRHGRH